MNLRLNDFQKKLIEDNLSLVRFAVRRYINPVLVADEDIISQGYIGLCKAASNFREECDVKFSSFAVICILNEIRAEYRKIKRHCLEEHISCLNLNMSVPLEDHETQLLDMIADPKVDTEKDALDSALIESLEPIVPTTAYMIKHDLDYKAMANLKGVSRQAIHQQCQRERARALRRYEAHF